MRARRLLVRRWRSKRSGRRAVDDVYIRFIDGTAIRFRVREFDINVGGEPPRRTSLDGSPTRTPTVARRLYTCGWIRWLP
jgi:hypothetical protein